MSTESPTDRVHRAIHRIAETDRPEIWITRRSDADLLDEAAEIERRLDSGDVLPLAGRLFAVKSNIDVEGLPTTAAHPGFTRMPDRDSSVVARLRAAGAIVIGSMNMDQFATGLVGSRSPYGAVRAAHHPDRVSGGSSSGSAVAVALDIADFSLGTDTAGSGRVPAALNGIVGIKATRGLVPTDGVVPASRSYDCVTVFARTLDEGATAMRIAIGPSDKDPLSRSWPSDVPLGGPLIPRIAIPRAEDLAPLDTERKALFFASVVRLREHGAEIVEIDLTPFLESAKLLYEGALVAERAAAYGDFLTEHPEGADPTVAIIARAAGGRTAVELVRDQERLDQYRVVTDAVLGSVTALLVPTAASHPTLGEVAAEPMAANSRLGIYTNFLNLLDLAGVAVPAGSTTTGMFGVTVVVPAFHDQIAIDIAALLVEPAVTDARVAPAGIGLAVFGAHLTGQPLNGQLRENGARFDRAIRTAPDYAMVALPGAVAKPGIVRTARGAGTSLAAELWQLPAAGLGEFLAALPQPMALGKITLDDGSEVLGFACTDPSGPDISEFGGWLAYLASL